MALLFTLQISANINVYDTPVSASASFYLENFRDFVAFKRQRRVENKEEKERMRLEHE